MVWSYRLDLLDSTLTESPQLLAQAQNYQAPFSPAQGRGRPHRVITQEQLEYLRYMKFSWTQISKLLGVSRMTVYRRRRDLGNLQSDHGLSISDALLSSLLQQIRREMPNIGENLVLGRIHSLGFSVTRHRLRQVIHATDPLNTALRWRGIATARRPYSVPAPNSLWHIGNFVI